MYFKKNKWWQYFDVHPLDRNRVGFFALWMSCWKWFFLGCSCRPCVVVAFMRSSGTLVVCLCELLSSASHRTRTQRIALNMTQNGHMTLQLTLHIQSPEETHQRNVAVDRRRAMAASKTASPPINASSSVMKSKLKSPSVRNPPPQQVMTPTFHPLCENRHRLHLRRVPQGRDPPNP